MLCIHEYSQLMHSNTYLYRYGLRPVLSVWYEFIQMPTAGTFLSLKVVAIIQLLLSRVSDICELLQMVLVRIFWFWLENKQQQRIRVHCNV